MNPGEMLGPYRIVGKLGEGGMGAVYKALDTRLNRTVAIKVLLERDAMGPDPRAPAASPAAGARDERRRRLVQEARAVSALNHPHICVLYDVGSQDGTDYLVMEHLEGQTLAERLTAGALPLAQSLDLAIQMADALTAAHRAGVVHRDLKPSNVMLVKASGGDLSVKLLDFGLARITAAEPASAATVTLSAVGVGAGTVPYMAPEQVEGRAVDARTDLFAFGAVLYEMLTGTRAFAGASAASVMAAILEHEPQPLSRVLPLTPPALNRVLSRCLAKEPDARWQSAADLAAELRWLREGDGGTGSAAVPPRRRGLTVLPAIGAAVALFAGGAALMWAIRPVQQTAAGLGLALHAAKIGAIGFSYAPGGSRTAFAWSADGRTLLVGNADRLYARGIDDAVARPIPGTEGAQEPVVSPDGRHVAFWTRQDKGRSRGIKVVPTAGGAVVDLVPDVGKPVGMAWDEAGNLYFGKPEDRIWVVGADRTTKPVTTRADGEITHGLPALLPGGQVLLYTSRSRIWSWGDDEIIALALADGRRKRLLTDAADARYLPTGHLAFMRRGTLMAIAFDKDRLEVRGKEEVVQGAVSQALAAVSSLDVTGAGQFAVAPTGALAWIGSGAVEYPDTALVRVDRHGAKTRLAVEPLPYNASVRLSPDGRRLAVTAQSTSTGSVRIYDLERTTLETVVEGGEGVWAHWRPRDQGRRLLVDRTNGGRGSFAWVPSQRGGGEARVLRPSAGLWASSFAPDGRLVLLRGTADLEVVSTNIDDAGAPFETLVKAAEWPTHAEVSPDGRWLVYTSHQSSPAQVYVKPLSGPGVHMRVSVDGGDNPAWSPRGDELFFTSVRSGDGAYWMMAARFASGRVGAPQPLFQFSREELAFTSDPVRTFDIAPNGEYFYTVQRDIQAFPATVTHINYDPNWLGRLKAKVPTR